MGVQTGMTHDMAYNLICSLYATFGRSAPSRSSAVVAVITERIASVPDNVAADIRRKLEELDSMPSNLGKAIIGAWETWQMENSRAVYRETCPVCDGGKGFEAYEKLEDGTVHHFFAPCPNCSIRRKGFRYLTPKQWKTQGVLCMPPGYPGGKLQFEYDYGITEKPEDSPKSYRNMRALKLLMNHRTGYDRGYAMQDARKAS